MRWFLLCVLALTACSSKDRLKEDMEFFCNAAVANDFKTFVEVGPYVVEHTKSPELHQVLAGMAGGRKTAWELSDELQAMAKAKGIDDCKTLRIIVPPRRE
ncbi:MAG TPA: hypothetical protein VM513_21860 [Kofleriaceae bacterium]|jgi:hypothetical protein|nr:hypothetical protein [Kofleriaceae bacterium]